MKEERKLRKSKKWIALAASFAVLMSCFSGFATVSAFGADTPVSAYSASDVYPLMATSYTGWQRPTSSQSVKTGLYVNTTTSLTDGGSATFTNLDFGSDGLDQIKIGYTGFNRADTVMDVYLGTDNTGTTIASITLPKGSKWGTQLYVTADLLEGVSVTGVQDVHFKIRGLAVKYSDNSWDNIFDFTGLTFIKKAGVGTPVASAAVSITAPVTNASPANASTASEEFSVTSTVWKKGGEVFTGKFKYGDTYTASVTLTANGNMGYAFDASTTVAEIPGATVSNVTVTGEGEGNTLTFDAAFDSVAGIDAYSASAVYPSMATAKTGWKNGTGSNAKVLMVDTTTCTTLGESALYTDLDFGPKGLGRVEILYSVCNSVPLTLEIFQGTDATGTKIGEVSIKGNNWAVNQTVAADITADVKGVQSIYLKVDGVGVNTDKANNVWDNVFDFRGLTFVEKEIVYAISGFTPLEPRNHTIGSSAAPLPAQVEAVYEDGSKTMVSVAWDSSAYDLNRAGTYTVTGTVDGTDLKPTVTLVVYEPVDGSYSVSGTFELNPGSDTEGTYTVKTALKGMKAVAGTFGLAYDDSIMTLKADGIAYTNGAKTAGVTLPAGTNYVMAGWISSDAGGQSPIDASVAPVEILTFSFDMSKRNYDLMLDRDSLGIYQYTGGDTSLWDNGGYLIDSGTAYAFAADNTVAYAHDDRYLTTITALSGAAIEIGGYTLIADEAGQVKLALANGSVAYKVSKAGYRTMEGTLTASNGEPLTITMTEQGYYTVVKTITGGTIVGADRASDSADYTFTVEADEPNVTAKVAVTVNGAAVSPQVSGNTYTIPAAKITGDIEIVVTFVGPVNAYSASDVYPLMATSYTGWQRPTSSQSVKTGLYVNTTTSLTDGGSATFTNLDFGSDGLDQIKIGYTGFNRADTVMDVYLGTDNTGTTIASITLPKGSKWGTQLYVTADLLEGVSVTGVQDVHFKIRGLAVKYSDNSWDNIFDFTGLTFIKKAGVGTPVASAAVAITAPVTNASPANASTASEEFSVTSTVWKKGGEVFTGKFKYGDTYTASVTLTANGNLGYAFDANTTVAEIPGATVSNVTVTGEGEGNTLTFDAAFDSVAGIDAYSASAVYPSMATAKTGWKNGTGSNAKVLMVDTTTCTTVEESALYTDLDFGPKGLGRVEILYSVCNSVPLTLEIFQGTDATGTKIGEMSIKGNNWAVNQTVAADIAAEVKGVQPIYLKVDGVGVNTDKAKNIWDNVFDFRGLTFVEKTSAPTPGSITVSGIVAIDGAARFGETLTANVSGIAPAGATCDLAWYRAGAAGAVATGATYTLTAADVGKVITLKATGTGAYTGELTAATTVVEKAAGPAAPAAPALASKTGATVTLTTVSGQEYRKGTDGQWQTDGVFSGLAAGTRYEFYTRVAETGTHQAGAVSPALAVTTDTYAIHMESGGTVLTSGAVALSLGTATEDYTAAESATITIRNSGTGTVTGLKAALSGAGANSFTLGTLSANEIAQGASATFTAAPKTGLAVGTHRATVTVTADNSVTESFDVTFEVTVKASGVAVSGRFTSYDPKKVATITLTNDADASKVYSVTVGAISGQGQNAADFTLEGVTAGTYTLVITKPTHLSFTVKNIVVGETDVDLTTDSRSEVQNMRLLCGDVLGEGGAINASDMGTLKNSVNFNKSISEAGNPMADLDGNGAINASDLGILVNAINFNKRPVVIE